MRCIHENKAWPNFTWDAQEILPSLSGVRHKQGLLLGRMRSLGFDLQADAAVGVLTSDVVRSSAIEGEQLDECDVRSSIARRLALPNASVRPRRSEAEGIVEMKIDATRHAARPITTERLWGWHAALFPVG